MARSQRYKVKFRRRRELKTDYAKRLALIKSNLFRLVVRRSSGSILGQVVEFSPTGDKTLHSATAVELKELGWKGGLGNIPAAYLTGLLLAKKFKSSDKVILDLGMQHPARGGRLFALLKGCADGGMNVPVDQKAFPSEDRIGGAHISSNAVTKYTKVEREITQNFAEVKKKIQGGSQ